MKYRCKLWLDGVKLMDAKKDDLKGLDEALETIRKKLK